MSQELTDFVEVIPVKSLNTLLSFVRGNQPAKAELALAGINVQSFAAGKFLGNPIPIMATVELTDAAVEAAILDVLPDSDGTMKAGGISALTLLTLLRYVGPLILKFLS